MKNISNVSVAIAMPVHNESEGIQEFLNEIAQAFEDVHFSFVVIDDLSSDDTFALLNRIKAENRFPIFVESNEINIGHGPSTLKALSKAKTLETDFVIAVDGDGQFLGSEMRQLFDQTSKNYGQVGEGVRTHRSDPTFRKFTTQLTRILVGSRCGSHPVDANTPLRVYPSTYLAELLAVLPTGLLTPNLYISAYSRLTGKEILEMKVHSLPRRGTSSSGTMWKARTQILPSKRFIKFCIAASSQWFKVSLPKSK